MNKRLSRIADYVPPGRGLIDVGTDHGYLVEALARRGYPGRLIAADIGEGPLSAARRTMRQAGLEDRVEFQLCDGLSLCDSASVDCIVIAGMGGDTICGILDRAEWLLSEDYLLILQPMSRAEVLRYWLIHNGFGILREDLVRDGDGIYPILLSRFGGVTELNEAELFTGSAGQICHLPLAADMVDRQIRRVEKTLAGLSRSDPGDGRTALYQLILAQLKEVRESCLR